MVHVIDHHNPPVSKFEHRTLCGIIEGNSEFVLFSKSEYSNEPVCKDCLNTFTLEEKFENSFNNELNRLRILLSNAEDVEDVFKLKSAITATKWSIQQIEETLNISLRIMEL